LSLRLDGDLDCVRSTNPVKGQAQAKQLSGSNQSFAIARIQHYFKRRCEQQPSPIARETRPPRGRVFRFLRSDFEGWARAVGRALSRGLNHGVDRLPRWPTGWAESLSGSLPGQGAGLRQGRSRWSGHYRGRARWFGPDPLRPAGDDSAHAEGYGAFEGGMGRAGRPVCVLVSIAQPCWATTVRA
jgi:hypothetical protein